MRSSDLQPSRDPASTLANGSSLGRFVILGLVGRGAMGEVYGAYDPNLDRKIAIKLVISAGRGVGRPGRSQPPHARSSGDGADLPSNVVVVYEADTLDDRVFIAMEFVEGHTLRYWLQAKRRTWLEILDVFIAAGRGLAAAHEKDLVHRDFKPDNVMVSRRRAGARHGLRPGPTGREGPTGITGGLRRGPDGAAGDASFPSGSTPRSTSTAVIDPEATQATSALPRTRRRPGRRTPSTS